MYEGIEKETPKSTRHKLINPYYFCGSTHDDETNDEFWNRVYDYIENTYDISKIKKIFLNGDGGAWIKNSTSRISGITYVLDEFHMTKYLIKMTSHMEREFSKEDVAGFRKILKEIIKDNTKDEFRNAIDYLQEYAKSDSEKAKIADAGDYFLSNWIAAKDVIQIESISKDVVPRGMSAMFYHQGCLLDQWDGVSLVLPKWQN